MIIEPVMYLPVMPIARFSGPSSPAVKLTGSGSAKLTAPVPNTPISSPVPVKFSGLACPLFNPALPNMAASNMSGLMSMLVYMDTPV